MNILSLQPFYGGSHRQFEEGWKRRSRHEWTTLSLPDRHWKWRMRHAAIELAWQVEQRFADCPQWDAVFCTDMLNVAEFRGLAPSVRDVPLTLYFHENQFAYPNRFERKRDQHFAFTNFVSAVAADRVWFNSAFNRDSMLNGLRTQAKIWPDFVSHSAIDQVELKAQVLHPGIEVPDLDWPRLDQARHERIHSGDPLTLLWAARWEHDKNPANLLIALRQLRAAGVPFRLSVIGEQFRTVPPEFTTIRTEFGDAIDRWGYQPDRQSYWQAINDSDVFISTATHEFFGLAAAEALAAGVFSLLPDRLAYPELVSIAQQTQASSPFLYDGTATSLADRIAKLHANREQLLDVSVTELRYHFRDRLNWQQHAQYLDAAME